MREKLKELKIATSVIVLFMSQIRAYQRCLAKHVRTNSMLLASVNGSDHLTRATVPFVRITSSEEERPLNS